MENTKICSKCGRELPLECFGKHKSRKDGLQSYCKDCFKQYRADNAEYFKQWRADNLEYMKQYNKQWRAEHAEARKQYMKQWYAEHRAEWIEKMKQYYSTIEGYANMIRYGNLREDRMYGRISADEDPLPSVEQYIELLQQRDYYDGKQYHWSEMGLDRIDNSKPHTLDNVVPCTTEHNRQRGRKSFEDFRERMQNSF